MACMYLEGADRLVGRGRRDVVRQPAGDQTVLRLVVLNSCEGARTTLTDPYAGVATTLVRLGVPAVVAMQFEISDEAAIVFAEELYTNLIGRQDPIDAAVGRGPQGDLRRGRHASNGRRRCCSSAIPRSSCSASTCRRPRCRLPTRLATRSSTPGRLDAAGPSMVAPDPRGASSSCSPWSAPSHWCVRCGTTDARASLVDDDHDRRPQPSPPSRACRSASEGPTVEVAMQRLLTHRGFTRPADRVLRRRHRGQRHGVRGRGRHPAGRARRSASRGSSSSSPLRRGDRARPCGRCRMLLSDERRADGAGRSVHPEMQNDRHGLPAGQRV